MRPRSSQVVEDVGVVAAGFFNGIGQNGHAVECTLLVDGLSHFGDCAILPGEPNGFNGERTERKRTEDATEQTRLVLKFHGVRAIGIGGVHCLGSLSHHIDGRIPISGRAGGNCRICSTKLVWISRACIRTSMSPGLNCRSSHSFNRCILVPGVIRKSLTRISCNLKLLFCYEVSSSSATLHGKPSQSQVEPPASKYYPGLKVAHSCHESSSFRPPEVAVMAILLPDAREFIRMTFLGSGSRLPVPCSRVRAAASPKSKSLASSGVARGDRLRRWWGRLRRPRRARFATAALLGIAGFGPPSLSDAQAEHLRQLVRTHQPEELGIAAPLWTRRAVRDLIRKEFDLDLAEADRRPGI